MKQIDYFALRDGIGQVSHRKHLTDILETKDSLKIEH